MTSTDRTSRNKQLVLHCFTEFAAGNTEILRTVLHDDFIEHSPGNPSGKTAFIDFITREPVASARLELARVIADDDFVAVHYRLIPSGGGPDLAVVDIWRLADGRIVEHWDVVQPVPLPAEVPHGMF